MTILTLIGMLALVVVLVLYIIELSRNRRLSLKADIARKALRNAEELSRSILQNVNAFVTLIDRDFIVSKTNYYDITKSAKPESGIVRLGDLLRCCNALSAGGCGTHELCSNCPIRGNIERHFKKKSSFTDLQVTLNIRNRRGDAIDFIGSVAGEFMIMPDGKEGMVVTVHDVTRMKNIEEELRRGRIKAEEADRSKSAFLANMSHEIRTPLNAIVGFSELLASACSEEEKAQYLNIVRSNNELLQRLISDILDLSKIEAGTLEFTFTEINVSQMIFEVEQFSKMRLGEKESLISISKDVPAETSMLYTDRNRLMQVLTNFMINAIKFTDEGSITLGYKPCPEGLYFYVKDSGSGIPADKVDHIFERFMRVGSEKQGTGLGLSICQTIAHKLGGDIGVESEYGKGSTFWITLPINNRQMPSA